MSMQATIGSMLLLLVAASSAFLQAEQPSVIVSSPGNPLVSFRLMFQTGSSNDPAGKEGLNTLTAMMLSGGGTETLSLIEVNEKLYPMAAIVSAEADKEVTTLVGRVHRDFLKDFYTVYRDLLLHPRFDPKDFERNRNQLLSYITKTLRGSDDEQLGKTMLEEMLYAKHPFGHPTQGTAAGLRSITLEERT